MTIRLVDPRFQIFDGNGNPLPGAKIHTYEAGTSTPLATYEDSALTVPAPNPIVCDADGRVPDIFLGAANYRMVCTDANDVTLWTADPVDGASANLLATLMEVTGTANAIILTSPFVSSTYQAGQSLRFEVASTNTGAVTVNWNGLGVRSILNVDGGPLTAGMLREGQLVEIIYDGSAFRLTASSGWQFISEVSGAMSVYAFTLPAWPTKFRIDLIGLSPVLARALVMQFSYDGGSTWKNTEGDYVGVYADLIAASLTPGSFGAQTGVVLAGEVNASTNLSGYIEFENSPNSRGSFSATFINGDPQWSQRFGGFASIHGTATNVRFVFAGTTFAAGRIRLRGIA